MTPKTDEERGLRSALWAIALSGAALTLGSPFVLGRDGVLGVALGAVIAAFNLWSLGRIVRAFMNGAGLPWVLLAALKLVGLLAVVAVVLKLGITTVIPLAVGYGALPLGIVFAQLGAARPRVATSPQIQGGISDDSGPEGR
ncbi:MAG TPA: hypothetical protein VHP33_02710 [Polyangiaceae bacterium]|nr:hypothetical protein [Polyangiaceae bacterium]